MGLADSIINMSESLSQSPESAPSLRPMLESLGYSSDKSPEIMVHESGHKLVKIKGGIEIHHKTKGHMMTCHNPSCLNKCIEMMHSM